jgi:dCTP deaminase
MILSDTEILEAMNRGNLKIDPFNEKCLGSNSYDVHLGPELAWYEDITLDAKKEHSITYRTINEYGFVLMPERFYMGTTMQHVPFLEGKSSIGRLGIEIHATAGKGDIGFKGYWTLEISVKQPVRVYAGMPIGQLIYFAVYGEVKNRYDRKESAKYTDQPNRPVASKMWMNFL